MGKMLSALLQLQAIERQLAQVKGRLRTRKNAVAAQQKRIDQLKAQQAATAEQALQRRKQADSLELDVKKKDEEVAKFRTALNTAKTNKEYAAILTQINTLRADNAKLEEEALKTIQSAENIKEDLAKIQQQIDNEAKRLSEIEANSAEEIAKLTKMKADLDAKRGEAAKEVPDEALHAFDRIASGNDGDAMAAVEIHGRRPPFEYICGGCFMSLNAEHANALKIRDEIRTCDNCGRILYLEASPENTRI